MSVFVSHVTVTSNIQTICAMITANVQVTAWAWIPSFHPLLCFCNEAHIIQIEQIQKLFFIVPTHALHYTLKQQ
jgi:hypothetical protein